MLELQHQTERSSWTLWSNSWWPATRRMWWTLDGCCRPPPPSSLLPPLSFLRLSPLLYSKSSAWVLITDGGGGDLGWTSSSPPTLVTCDHLIIACNRRRTRWPLYNHQLQRAGLIIEFSDRAGPLVVGARKNTCKCYRWVVLCCVGVLITITWPWWWLMELWEEIVK